MKFIQSQNIYPELEIVAYSDHTFYNVDYIKISEYKYQNKQCKIENHW